MNARTVGTVLILEGLASAGLQMLMIRQVQGYVGSSVLVTSIVISVFLAALATGWYVGGKSKKAQFQDLLSRNLVISIGLFGIGLSYPVVDVVFSSLDSITKGIPFIDHVLFHLFIFSCLFLFPLVFVLGQTVPLLLHTARSETSKSESAGNLTALSTIGNVFGGLITALILMTLFGVGASIVVNVLILLAALFFVIDLNKRSHLASFGLASAFLAVSLILNVIIERELFDATTPYGNVKVVEYEEGRAMLVNNQYASYYDKNQNAWPYIEIMRSALIETKSDKNVLVLGAGGYTLSATPEMDRHRFTYVDIDASLKEIAETRLLLNGSVVGETITEDARAYLLTRERMFDVIVVDLFSSSVMIPAHTATLEFFSLVRSRLNKDGFVMINIAANPMLEDEYSARIDKTVRSAFDRCVTDITRFRDGLESLVYFCRGKSLDPVSAYRDDKEAISIDAFMLAKSKKEER